MSRPGTILPVFTGAPGVSRTRGTRIRNPLLYPSELRGRCWPGGGAINMALVGCQLFPRLPYRTGTWGAHFAGPFKSLIPLCRVRQAAGRAFPFNDGARAGAVTA